MIKVGIIGCGARAGTHINLIKNYFSDISTITCICDKYQEKVDNVNTILGTNFTTYVGDYAYIDMLKNETLDLVVISTPWEWHAKMVIECMNNGIRSGVEVPMATTLEECERIIETYKKTGIDSMILENVCWRDDVLSVLNMKRFDLFGKINFASGGYMHDIRQNLIYQERYTDWWRIEHYRNRMGDNYPTHGLGPVQNWLDINKGNRMLKITSYSNNALGLKHLLTEKKNTINKYYNADFNTGDVVKSIIQTSNGELIEITLNTTSARPYSLDFSLQGTKGLWDRRLGLTSSSSIYFETFTEDKDNSSSYNLGDVSCQATHTWGDGDSFINKYSHPLYIKYKNQFSEGQFHGGMDWYMMNSFLNSVKNNIPFSISIYDSITMSIIVDLSRQSLLLGSKTIDIPDFTDGFWFSDNNYFENCFYIKNDDIIYYSENLYYTIIPDYKEFVCDSNFHLYQYDKVEEPIELVNQTNLTSNMNFSVNGIPELHNYLSFNHPSIRDSHYLIIQETTAIKSVSFYFKKYDQIFDTQVQSYWSYLLDGRPGNSTTYLAFRPHTVTVGTNIEKIEINGQMVTNEIGSYLYDNIKNNNWYSLRIYFSESITDDLSIFSRYNNKEDFDGAIANIILYDENSNKISKYDFKSYDTDNRFLNTITNEYDLKVYGTFNTGKVHSVEETDNLFNTSKSNIDTYNDNSTTDIILFFKNGEDILNKNYCLY